MDKIKYDKLKERVKNNYEKKDSYSTGANILNLPDDIEFFKAVKGRNSIDIIPYEIKSDKHPELKKGEMDYVLDIWTHRQIGVGKDNFICLAKTYKKPCPICEELERLRKEDGDEKDIKALKPVRRVIYNVLDHSDYKVKIFEVSHHLFEKELLDEAGCNGSGEIIDFYNPIDGKSIKFRAVENDTLNSKKPFFEFKSFSFEDREEQLTEKILNQALSLDSLLNIPDYNDIYNVLFNVEIKKEDSKSEEYYEDVIKKDSKQENEIIKHRKNNTKKCPYGYEFGIDSDDKSECKDCEESIWNACLDEKENK